MQIMVVMSQAIASYQPWIHDYIILYKVDSNRETETCKLPHQKSFFIGHIKTCVKINRYIYLLLFFILMDILIEELNVLYTNNSVQNTCNILPEINSCRCFPICIYI